MSEPEAAPPPDPTIRMHAVVIDCAELAPLEIAARYALAGVRRTLELAGRARLCPRVFASRSPA